MCCTFIFHAIFNTFSKKLGAKKGLGATKVQANFEDIEREAHMADAARAQKPVEVKPEVAEQKVCLVISLINK